MFDYKTAQKELAQNPRRWLVTGAAGFVGSNICEKLIGLGQDVFAVDNLSTGFRANIDFLENHSTANAANNNKFHFVEGDVREQSLCEHALEGRQHVLHQAALGSVPRSIEDPIRSHDHNVNGFLQMLRASSQQKDTTFVYASSSSVYGDSPLLPKVESHIGAPLSPYAATKAIDEMYASVFSRTYNIRTTGLRYFNVFGPRQSPSGAYAAVIPRWVQACLAGVPPEIYGDGETTRDFCFVDNAVQANILASVNPPQLASAEVYNVAAEKQTSLNQLLSFIQKFLSGLRQDYKHLDAKYFDFRQGDVRHSLADITKARKQIGYHPQYDVESGLERCIQWYAENL